MQIKIKRGNIFLSGYVLSMGVVLFVIFFFLIPSEAKYEAKIGFSKFVGCVSLAATVLFSILLLFKGFRKVKKEQRVWEDRLTYGNGSIM